MHIHKTEYLGERGDTFNRVGLAFEIYGYKRPHGETEANTGAFVSNIISQYSPHLSETTVLALIEYGKTNTRENLLREKEHPDWLTYTLEQLTDNYVDRYILPE